MAKGTKTDEHKSVFGNHKRNNGDSARKIGYDAVPNDLLFTLIDKVTSRGGAVRFGYTRDGGAYAVGFYYGSESSTEYCRPNESLEDFMKYWIEFYENLPFTGGKSPQE